MIKDREKKLRAKEIDEILNKYWDVVVSGRTKTRRHMHSADYVQGFNMAIHKLIETRVITKKMILDSLNR